MGKTSPSDEDLWARSLDGESEAFGLLFDEHRDRVFRHAYRLGANRYDAEDIVATTFLELWRRRSKVRLVEGSILPWLLVTASNVARNLRRSAARYRKLIDALPRTEEASEPLDEPYRLDPLEMVDEQLVVAVRKLGRIDRQLISLVVFEGYKLAEASTLLGISASAAKTRMFRARERLKEALGTAIAFPTQDLPNGVRP